MSFLNPDFLWFLWLVPLPLLFHVISRQRVHFHAWSSLRFFRPLHKQFHRRWQIQTWLLLFLRCSLLALVVFYFARPVFDNTKSQSERPRGSISALILIDNSASSQIYLDTRRHIDHMKTMAQSYLDSLRDGDEVSIITTASLDHDLHDPLYDRDEARRQISAIDFTDCASDWPRLFARGFEQLSRHVNTHTEIICIHDGLAQGWHQHTDRWQEVTSQLAVMREHRRVELWSCSAAGDVPLNSVFVRNMSLGSDVIPVGAQVPIEVELGHVGVEFDQTLRLSLLVDGDIVAEQDVVIAGRETVRVEFEHRFLYPGQRLLEARLSGFVDSLAYDNSYAHVVEVRESVSVLLVEDQSELRFFSAALQALDKEIRAHSGNSDDSPLFELKTVHFTSLSDHTLQDYQVVVLAPIPALDIDSIAQIEQYVAAGGGVLVSLGAASDPQHLNDYWVRHGDGFLPCQIGGDNSQSKTTSIHIGEDWNRLQQFTGIETFSSVQIRDYFKLEAVPGQHLQKLLLGDQGQLLLTQQQKGYGQVMVWASGLDETWTDLPRHGIFVPLVRYIINRLGARLRPSYTVQAGESFVSLLRSSLTDHSVISARSDDRNIALRQGDWLGQDALVTDPLLFSGVYFLRRNEQLEPFVVQPHPGESILRHLDQSFLEFWQRELRAQHLNGLNQVQTIFTQDTHLRQGLNEALLILLIVVFVGEQLLRIWFQPKETKYGRQRVGERS